MENSAVENSAVENSAVGNSAMANSVVAKWQGAASMDHSIAIMVCAEVAIVAAATVPPPAVGRDGRGRARSSEASSQPRPTSGSCHTDTSSG